MIRDFSAKFIAFHLSFVEFLLPAEDKGNLIYVTFAAPSPNNNPLDRNSTANE